jgi:hypothetical protein
MNSIFSITINMWVNEYLVYKLFKKIFFFSKKIDFSIRLKDNLKNLMKLHLYISICYCFFIKFKNISSYD